MKEVKIIFLQADKEDFAALGALLGSIQQTDYFFILIPQSVKVLSKKEVIELLSACRN